MRYLLIVVGFLLGLFDCMLSQNSVESSATQGKLFCVIGGFAFVVGSATCDIVNAIRERRPPDGLK